MIRKMLLVLIAVAAVVMTGCKKQEPAPPAEPKITQENLDTELEKMEAEIEADIAAEK
ncbi:MAG: hypothetical protein ACYS72_05620 [Planctomycetota bacterium]|jgi:PBP1b-binding outer membrane lipoprotein LpoB